MARAGRSREFLYVDDAARALLLATERLNTSAPVNVGTGRETRIRDLAALVRRARGLRRGEKGHLGQLEAGRATDPLPGGSARARADPGFEAEVPLEEELPRTIESYRASPAVT